MIMQVAFQANSNVIVSRGYLEADTTSVIVDNHLFRLSNNQFPNVVAIDKDAFKNNDKLFEILLGSLLNEIRESAFENCSKLKGVKIDSSDNEAGNLLIQHHAFKDCKELDSVVIHSAKNLIIEKEAFLGCGALKTVVFDCAGGVTIADDAFKGCGLVAFVSPPNPYLEAFARTHA